MKLENQVCSLEQASKLATLEIKQKSIFYWAINSYNQESKEITMRPDDRDIVYAAFTVAELCEMLPFYLVDRGELTLKKNYVRERSTGWNITYAKTGNCNEDTPAICAKNQAEVCAMMLIYLIENSIINHVQVNQRLSL